MTMTTERDLRDFALWKAVPVEQAPEPAGPPPAPAGEPGFVRRHRVATIVVMVVVVVLGAGIGVFVYQWNPTSNTLALKTTVG